MGKNYDAYENARKAEQVSNARYFADPTPENETNARQNQEIANVVFQEMLDDPEN